MDPLLEKAKQKILHPYLTGLTQTHFISLLIDRKGKIAWALNSRDNHSFVESIDFLLGKSIQHFYKLEMRAGYISDNNRVKSFQEVLDYYKRTPPEQCLKLSGLLGGFPSKNIFEKRFQYQNFTSNISMSFLRLVTVNEKYYLGIIYFNYIMQKIVNWYSGVNPYADINLITDEENRLVGFDDNFANAAKSKPVAGAPVRDYLDLTFLRPLEPGQPLIGKGSPLFEFKPGEKWTGTTNAPNRLKTTNQGLVLENSNSLNPLFLELPFETDFHKNDYDVRVTTDLHKGDFPFLIAGAVPVDGHTFPDARGLIFSSSPYKNRPQEKTTSFLLKKMGDTMAVAKTQLPAPRKTTEPVDFILQKKGGHLVFYVNGQILFDYPVFRLPQSSKAKKLVLGIRPKSTCRLVSFQTTVHPKSETAQKGERDVTFFHRNPEKKFRVHAWLLPHYGHDNLVYCYRLEDMGAVEKLRTAIKEKKDREAEIRNLKKKMFSLSGLERIVGESTAMERVKATLKATSSSNVPILITGETGTGKSVLAQSIHESGPRAKGPFVKVDLSSLPPSLVASELFGFEKGAFTGATASHKGRFEQAQGGTIFLDEIGNIDPDLQSKLLTVLQDMTIYRIGGTRSVALDIQILSATNQTLETAIAEGRFRKDLYYRLNVVHLNIPPLRKRPEDIPLLCEHFLKTEFARYDHKVATISPLFYQKLMTYPWPGNIRELYNLVLKCVILCQNRVLTPADIPPLPEVGVPRAPVPQISSSTQEEVSPPPQGRRKRGKRTTSDQIVGELKKTEGNIAWAADNLGISRTTIYRKLGEAGVDPNQF